MSLPIKFKKLHPDAVIPQYAHPGDAGMDLYSVEDVPIHPGAEPQVVSLGLAVELPPNSEMQIRPRSGLAVKGLTVVNSPGTIDQGYRGELKVILANLGYWPIDIKKGDRIAQAVVKEVPKVIIKEVESFTSEETARGESGFGSTGR